MKKGLLYSLALALLLGASFTSFGQSEGVGAGAVFRDGVDARALAMGGAFAAIADSYSASYWNPAGIAKAAGTRIGLMNTNKFGQGINFNYVSGSLNLGGFAVGGSFLGSSISGIEQYDANGNPVGTVDDNEIVFMGTGALDVAGIGYAGANVKAYNHSLAGGSAQGFGFDVGVLLALDALSVGVVATDLGGTQLQWSNTPSNPTDVVPAVFRAGGAFTITNDDGDDLVTVAAQFDFGGAENVLRLGAELTLPGTPIAVRAGAVKPDSADFAFTAGAGLALGNLKVDFAFLQNQVLGNSLVLSAEFAL
jgi:hypothetical protein